MSYQGLQKQTVSLRLAGGVNEGDDAFLADLPTVREATNVRFDARGTVAKRYGGRALTMTSAPTGDPNSIHEHKGSLVSWYPDGAYVYDDAGSDWIAAGAASPRPSQVLTDPIARGNNDSRRGDVCVVGNLMCVAWEEAVTNGTLIRYQFVDTSNDKLQVLARGVLDDGAGTPAVRAPRFVVIDSSATIVLLGVTGTSGSGTLRAATYTVSAGTYTFGASVSLTITANPDSTAPYDVATSGGTEYTVMTSTGATDTQFTQCNSSGATGTTEIAASFIGYALCYVSNGATTRFVAVGTSAGTWGYVAYLAADYSDVSATVSAISSYTPSSNLDMVRATVCQATTTGRLFVAFSGKGSILFNTGTPGTTTTGTDIIWTTTTLTTATRAGHVPGLSIAAKAVYLSDLDDVAVPLCEQIGVENAPVAGVTTELLPIPYGVIGRPCLADDGTTYTVAAWGRFLQDQIAKSQDGWHLSGTVTHSSGDVRFVATTLVEYAANIYSASLQTTRHQVDLVRATLSGAVPQRSVTSQSLRIMAGGAGSVCYDGFLAREIVPPPITGAYSNTSDPDPSLTGSVPSLDDGNGGASYPCKVLWRYRDTQGNIHRGSPSPSFTIAYDATDVMRVRFAGPGAFPVEQLEVEVYQAPQPDATDYRLIGIAKPLAHESYAGIYYVSIKQVADTALPAHAVHVLDGTGALLTRPALYTASEVDNVPPPPLLDVCSTQSRLWGISAERRLQVWYTKPIEVGEAPAWAAEFVAPIPDEGGDCTAIASLDDKIVVFKRDAAFVLFGDPGDAAGSGSSLQTARRVQNDTGCVDARSVVEGPFGVAFLSPRGFTVLDRGLSFTQLEAIRDSVPTAVTSGVLVPERTEVRWTTSGGDVLVWNYRLSAWSIGTTYLNSSAGSPAPVAACVWRGDWTVHLSDVAVHVETPDTWTADVTYDEHEMQVVTSWVKLAGLQGYKRVWKVHVLGRHYSGGLQIEIGYDYAPGWTDSFAFTQAQLAALRESDGKVQVVIRPTRQKCEALRFRFTESAEPTFVGQIETDNSGQGIELVGLDFEIGGKRGNFKKIGSGGKR